MSNVGAVRESDGQRRELRVEAGIWLKEQRESRSMSQRELAERVGIVYYTFVSQIEAGRGRIPSDRYELWAKALGIDPREFAIRMLSYYEPVTYQLIFSAHAHG